MNARCADAAFFNGRIITFDRRKGLATALAVEDGHIAGIGTDIEMRRVIPRSADKYDLDGKTVVPGFIDCHTHFIQMGVDSLNVDLSTARTIEEALSLMRAGARGIPDGGWVIGAGWMESGWPNERFITRADLDEACPNHAAVAHRICGHLSSVNSKAISQLNLDSRIPDVGTDASGNLTGILTESAVEVVRQATAPDRSTRIRGLARAVRKAHSLGVTSVHDNGEAQDFDIYRQVERMRKLGVRVWFNTPTHTLTSRLGLSLSTGIGSEWLKFGALKVFCDGALGARTAALTTSFADDPGNKGMFVHERCVLDELVARAHDSGIQLAIHAIGDAGIDVAISALSSSLDGSPRSDHRHRIEHLELPSKAHLKQMHRLGIIASMQPNFVGVWGGTNGMYVSRLGQKRASMNNPFRDVLRSGVRLAFGSDCKPFSPLYGMRSAIDAPYPSQRISVLEAFSAYTRDAAYASFEEQAKGTLSVGKHADFVVLSENPFAEPKAIISTNVLKTVIGGEVVFDRSSGRKASSRIGRRASA